MNKKIAAVFAAHALILSSISPAAAATYRAPSFSGVPRLAPAAVRVTAPTKLAMPGALQAMQLPATTVTTPKPTTMAAVAAAQKQGAAATMFDSAPRRQAEVGVMGFAPLPAPSLPAGVNIKIGQAPTVPKPASVGGVEINAFEVPGALTTGGIFDSGPKTLNVDPTKEADVERAVREMIDADAARFGVASNELRTIHVKRDVGTGEQADTIYVYFGQQRKSVNADGSSQMVDISGAYLSFTIKVINDQALVMAAMAHLYPNIAVDTKASQSDSDLKKLAEAQMPQNQGIELTYSERKIIFHEGAWKTANLYFIDGLPAAVGVRVAVDIVSGQVFAWDARMGLISGSTKARGESSDNRQNNKPVLAEQELPHLTLTVDGKPVVTDVNGKFQSSSDAPVSLTAALTGKWVVVNDRDGKPVKISATLKPGEDATIVANPTQDDIGTISQVNAYVWVSRIHDWWSALLKGDKRIDRAIPANVNINQDCNAYYTPGRPSLNFFDPSKECSDTARPGIIAHEYGHFIVDMIVPATTGGLHEGWGDIGSMFLLGTPIIGDGFLLNRTPSYIRHGENTYQYKADDEVHDQGQAWMGFAWKLRQALVAALGQAEGATAASSLIVPTLFAGSTEIPAAMAQVLLNAMTKKGEIRYEKEIRAAAKAHGIDLPSSPRGIASALTAKVLGIEESAPTAGAQPLGIVSQTTASDESLPNSRSLIITGESAAIQVLVKRITDSRQFEPGQYNGVKVEFVATGDPKRVEVTISGSESATDRRGINYVAGQIKTMVDQASETAASVSELIQATAAMIAPYDANFKIESFYNENKHRLSATDVNRLIAALQFTHFPSDNSRARVTERMRQD